MSHLDFSQFKKISQDKKMALLKHPDGHEIRIAISALSPIMKKKLIDIPVHAAEGEDIEQIEDSNEPIKEEIKQEIASNPQTPMTKENVEPNPAESVATPEASVETAPVTPDAASAPTVANPAPIASSPKMENLQSPPSAPLTPEQEATKMTAENLQFANDLRFGKIQPKTYQDLYANKSTLGKVGTIFGLLLSGAGSGLTHQPNALLDMINKEIERDLDAQKTNQANKQNWYRAALDHEKNQPENALRWAQASETGSKADFAQWSNTQAGVDDMTAHNNALNHQTIGTLQSLQDTINTMPQGPQRDQAQLQHDNVIVPYFLNKVMQRNQETAQKKATINATNPLPANRSNKPPTKEAADPRKKYDAINENNFNAMIQKGKFAPNAPDAIPAHLIDAVNREKTDLVVNRNNLADAADSFDALSKLKNAGQVPGISNASYIISGVSGSLGTLFGGAAGGALAAGASKLVTALPGETLKEYFQRNRNIQLEALKSRLGGNMSESDKNHLAESLLPSWADTDESMAEAHRKMLQHFESNPAEVAPNLSRYGLKYPLPNYVFKQKKEKEK